METQRISPAERGRQIQQRLAEGVRVPPAEEMRNSGRRRTPEKRRLLEVLRRNAEATGAKGFTANYRAGAPRSGAGTSPTQEGYEIENARPALSGIPNIRPGI